MGEATVAVAGSDLVATLPCGSRATGPDIIWPATFTHDRRQQQRADRAGGHAAAEPAGGDVAQAGRARTRSRRSRPAFLVSVAELTDLTGGGDTFDFNPAE